MSEASEPMKRLVIYHGGACNDGWCSRWLFEHAFPDAEFVAANYGEPPPDVAHTDVYLVDFSYPRDAMRRLISFNRSVTVLDHHKTAEADLAGLDDRTDPLGKCFVTFDMSKSGARLSWEYLWDGGHLPEYFAKTYSRSRAPWLVDYVEDRDLWKWSLPYSREINAALRSYPHDFQEWCLVGRMEPENLIIPGQAILRDQARTVASHVKHAREVELGGYTVLCVNATVLMSEIAGELAKNRPFGACWFRRDDGLFVYSLRSEKGGAAAVDVSQVAKHFGGGGHVNAAGFESKTLHEDTGERRAVA